MSTLPCLYCDGPIPASEAERASLCPLCSRPLTVCGRYRLKALLSKSETDRVYSASDGTQEVAVRVWLARDDDWTTISEFERIGRTLQSSKNKTLPQIFGWEKGGQGRLILVREKCQGMTLEDRLKSGQPVPPALLKKMLEDLLQALGGLHRLSPPLLHRDIRAANIVFRAPGDWSPVLVDFDPRMGSATTTTDLSSLGRVMELAGAQGELRSFVSRLANGGFSDADVALAELRKAGGGDSIPRRDDYVRPSVPKLGPTPNRPGFFIAMLVGLLVMVGFVTGLRDGCKKRKNAPKEATRTSSSDKGDSSVENYRSQCKSGDAMGCYNLGYRYEKGKGIGKDEPRAATLYRQSCDAGEKMACNNLAVLYESGRGVTKNPTEAARLYNIACDKRDWLACRNLGYLYSNGVGVKADVPRALKLYQDSCDHGEIRGCYNLGVLYETGKGVSVDFAKAMTLYQRACDGKDWEGCTNVGWMYAQGKGVPVDQSKAYSMYEKSCNGGDARGCNNFGVIFEKGRNVPIDYDRAFGLYTKACDGDDYYGCCNLGYFFESGKSASKDNKRAATLYQKSCRLGYDKGCQYLLDMVKDSRTATFARGLVERACDEGDNWSCEQIRKLK